MHIRGIFVCIGRTVLIRQSTPQHTSFIKAIVGNSILMGLMFRKRFTNGHNLLRAETRLSPSTYYFGKIYQRSSILRLIGQKVCVKTLITLDIY